MNKKLPILFSTGFDLHEYFIISIAFSIRNCAQNTNRKSQVTRSICAIINLVVIYKIVNMFLSHDNVIASTLFGCANIVK